MNSEKIDCMKCEYFVVTWNPEFPRGCKLYGFRTMSIPSIEVFKASGEECAGFTAKKPKNRQT